MSDETKANYSQSLLALATGRRQLLSESPLAFGESNTKARIRNVLNYKKPPFWVVVAALIATFALVILFTANPKNDLLSTNSVHSGYQIESLMANKTPYVGDIISWNFKHFVNIRTINKVQAVNKLVGYSDISILPPSMLVEGDETDDQ